MNVGDIMMPASKIDASSTVTEAARFMAEHNTHSVFVESQGKVKGIVTESDIVRKVVTQGIDSRRIMVYDIMTSPVVSVGKETSLEDASELMTRHKIRRLAIVEKGRIVGKVTAALIAKNLKYYMSVRMFRDDSMQRHSII